MDIKIVPMMQDDVPQVAALEAACFSDPWSAQILSNELQNELSLWLVAKDGDTVLGYVGSQSVLDEADMMNIAVRKDAQRQGIAKKLILALCARLAEDGPQEIVISGIHLGDDLGNFVFSGAKTTMVCAHRVGGYRSGTGDVFGAILAADLVNGVPLEQSVRKAAAFITKTIFYTQQLGVPETDGICFEEYLWELGRDTREVAI